MKLKKQNKMYTGNTWMYKHNTSVYVYRSIFMHMY